MGRVRWSKEADADFDSYSAWIWQKATTRDARAWLSGLLDWIEQLADFPRLGSPRHDLARELRTRSFRKSVLIAYTVDRDGGVTLLRVFAHGRNITAVDFADPE